VASLADRVAVVYGGMIVEDSPVDVLYRHPRHPYSDGLLGSVPGLPRDRLRPIPGQAPELIDVPAGCPFAPRCEFSIDACRRQRPELRRLGPTAVACIRAEELSLRGIAG
jgi:peptide/nickel transport system ATP-binding protein